MMYDDKHAHVVSICRAHFPHEPAQTSMIARTREEAAGYMHETPDPQTAAELDIKFTLIDNDIVKIHLGKQGHDLICFAVDCDQPFEECMRIAQRERAMAELEMRLRRMMAEEMPSEIQDMLNALMGADVLPDNQNNKQPTSEPSSNEAFMNIMNQIDLPEDFLGTGH